MTHFNCAPPTFSPEDRRFPMESFANILIPVVLLQPQGSSNVIGTDSDDSANG